MRVYGISGLKVIANSSIGFLINWNERGREEGASGDKKNSFLPRPLSDLTFGHLLISLRPAVAEELPDVAHLANLVEVQIGDHQLVVVARRLRDDLAAR